MMKKSILNKKTLAAFVAAAADLPPEFNAPAAGLTGRTATQYVTAGLLRVTGSEPYTFVTPDGETKESTRNLYAMNDSKVTMEVLLCGGKLYRADKSGMMVEYIAD